MKRTGLLIVAGLTFITPARAAHAELDSCSRYVAMAQQAGWAPQHLPKVRRLMWRESRCQPEVRSRTQDTGLMQINDVVLRDYRFRKAFPTVTSWQQLRDPMLNLRVARWLFKVAGWSPWRIR